MNKLATWQQALINAVTDPRELLEILELDMDLLPAAQKAAKLFPLKVPRGFINKMAKKNSRDPLLLQVLPIDAETMLVPGYETDPLKEKNVNPIPGLLHKYHSRVLFTFTGTCAINCRYCFRRHFAYEDNNPGSAGWLDALNYIQQDSTIKEVILSGGDPLIAPDQTLKNLTEKLATISHLKRLRIHTRIPVVLPERVTADLIQSITHAKLKTTMVLHANHPNEIDLEVTEAVRQLRQAGVMLLNQTVLLKNVNDDVETLVELSESLFDAGILPYYLHVLDKVQGAAHFDLHRENAQTLHRELSERLSGYLVPKLVYEQPGAAGKVVL
jgi:EF-P beta-lysylation protein EpmB